jgi:DNA invertase Pin-like site-specific DNA recombinase
VYLLRQPTSYGIDQGLRHRYNGHNLYPQKFLQKNQRPALNSMCFIATPGTRRQLKQALVFLRIWVEQGTLIFDRYRFPLAIPMWSRRHMVRFPLFDNSNGTNIMRTTSTEPHPAMTFIRAYLRASTDDQDATRARADLDRFATERGLKVASWYTENESGAKLERPELFRLIADAHPGDVLLVEQVDRLSRLNTEDWEALKLRLSEKRIRVVALDLPTSWMGAAVNLDETTQALLDAVNRMLLDMLAAVARKDYMDRIRRQTQGIEKAKQAGLYRGRQADTGRHAAIADMLDRGMSWSQVTAATGASRSTIKRVVDARKAQATA